MSQSFSSISSLKTSFSDLSDATKGFLLSGLFCAVAGAAHSAVSVGTYMDPQTGMAVGLTLAGMATVPGWFGTSVFHSLEAGNGVLAAGTVSAVAGAITFCV